MTNKELKMEKWAAEYVVDWVIVTDVAPDKFQATPVYLAFHNFFKVWHKDFQEEPWNQHITKQLAEL
jgi:hypothetical protein